MSKANRIEYIQEHIDQIATTLSQAYLEDGNFIEFYMGQISTPLQLFLFKPMVLETAILMLHHLGKSDSDLFGTLLEETQAIAEELHAHIASYVQIRFEAYQTCSDVFECFSESCSKSAQSAIEDKDLPIRGSSSLKSSRVHWNVALQESCEHIGKVAKEITSL